MVVGDRTYKQFRRCIDDYASIVNGDYAAADDLPEGSDEVSLITDIGFKLTEVPESYNQKLLQAELGGEDCGIVHDKRKLYPFSADRILNPAMGNEYPVSEIGEGGLDGFSTSRRRHHSGGRYCHFLSGLCGRSVGLLHQPGLDGLVSSARSFVGAMVRACSTARGGVAASPGAAPPRHEPHDQHQYER